ncbi:hypothetical protein [Burkholderia sp. Ac-20349]|uniref:hypothetical protein n=1 Tax=Burkholderia sp. Ac-20349 TaxID=2703893 RepID=UPI00197B9F53|nr:hypothetical protein [Burkholderia sp. Ac-20349]MBN3839220.1 hypothetical protein [Burkholderia sp. Ac-20349]
MSKILFFKSVKPAQGDDELHGKKPAVQEPKGPAQPDKPEDKPAQEPAAPASKDGEAQGDGGGQKDGFGPHNVEPGHHVAFAAGDFNGAGKVTASGEDGCTVADKTGREHRVHWHEVQGHHAGAE